jgi:hypothetical protein
MPRFSVGARVRAVEEKSTGRVGTVIEVLTKTSREGGFDRYRVEFADGQVEIMSDLELSPASSSPGRPLEEDVA